ncbi:thiamine import ATP binding protein [Candidatus Photodesmus blepharus]|uniref:Thiamine import ATP binding protein n=1 Tax=Candidatus Photodesmus blepharonis TaxID=1179155 RepID=A0A084CM84_9GAMM|nr:thiamine ABC transporter ATP-binding protein [Candidatus Photodesmus blepharus]KEY90913.1 thiamine import ATP binding protein [Candidatus Photodesmus blepharus]
MLNLSQVRHDFDQRSFLFNLEIKQGSIVALMGSSASGKSTLLNLIAGFIEPISGTIEVKNVSLSRIPPNRRPFSILFQEHNLFTHLTAMDNIGLGLNSGLRFTKEEKQCIVYAAEKVGVDEVLDRLPGQLSGGQRQRVALARCFVQSRSIWLLDEPFSALDPVLRYEMLILLKSLAIERNITVVMVTHDISDAKLIATNLVFLVNGRVEVAFDISELSNEMTNNPFIRNFIKVVE